MKYILALLVVLGAGATAFFLTQDQQVVIRLSEDQLLKAVEKKLPFEKTYLVLFDVTLDNPRITLVDGSERVQAGLDVAVEIRLGNKPPLRGSTDISGNVRYVPEEGEFYLVDPDIETLSIEGIPMAYTDKIDEVMTKALGAFFKTRPIYTLKESDTKQAAAKLVLKDVAVENSELVLTLGL
jgi:hypothetical protein